MIMSVDYSNVEYRPVFVYGSLLTGLPNHHIVADAVVGTVAGQTGGVQMYANGISYPFAVRGEGVIKGQIFWLDNDRNVYTSAMLRLDRLEGYKNKSSDLYTREVVRVVAQDGSEVEAWMYIASEGMAEGIKDQLPRLPDGDWRAFSEAVDAYLASQTSADNDSILVSE
jgi:gamma-glutamylcyclotransferase (GGCT)/AIG2-like uncharacterized protein YtfP